MKALVFHGPSNRAWEDKPKPSLKTAADTSIALAIGSVRSMLEWLEQQSNIPAIDRRKATLHKEKE
jgi:hypothetical protein